MGLGRGRVRDSPCEGCGHQARVPLQGRPPCLQHGDRQHAVVLGLLVSAPGILVPVTSRLGSCWAASRPLRGRVCPENTVTEELTADTVDARGTYCPGSAASLPGQSLACVGGDRAQGVHKLSFRPSQTRRDTARLLVCPDPGGPPPRGPVCSAAGRSPAPTPPRPRPFHLLGLPGRLDSVCCPLGHRGQPPGPRAVALAPDGRTCFRASACALVSEHVDGSHPRGRGLARAGCLLSLSPGPSTGDVSPSLRCVSCPPARLLKELCPEMTAVILSRVSGSAAACAEPGVWGLRTSSRRGSLRRAPARLRPAESSKEGRHAMWT
ncbi:uncharacterized protein LOC122454318 [Cervus canadensis]|uniref:uncharacterized protein LOC122454318 n=1 Tax=Cervus canadensis TaxID=1574408 RepID=UPI001C9E3303|nr:uncharacterized protein LOC122454318 [Cervus canadensis]